MATGSNEHAALAALRQSRELTGGTPGTLEAFLAVRGARTLALRLERAQQTALTLAERLTRHPNVTQTRYPGLASHPTHEAARRQLKGFGTIISFDVRGDAAAADAVCAALQLIQHATSLGAVKTRIDLQKDFAKSLMDAIDTGIGTLVDADMNEESTRLQALQVRQQLGIQALSLANQSSQSILSLFR